MILDFGKFTNKLNTFAEDEFNGFVRFLGLHLRKYS